MQFTFITQIEMRFFEDDAITNFFHYKIDSVRRSSLFKEIIHRHTIHCTIHLKN